MKHPFLAQIIMISLAAGAYSTAQAQQFNTDKSICQQLKDRTVPNLIFAPKKQLKSTDTTVQNRITGESFGQLYKSGKLPGMQYAPVPSVIKTGSSKLQGSGANENPQMPSKLPPSGEAALKPTIN